MFIDEKAGEIKVKLVYQGPGLGGKTTCLQYIFNKTRHEERGKMISLATETERALFFDFTSRSLGKIRGLRLRFHLYTVPGPVFHDVMRRMIMKGADGVMFVADSQRERAESNVESLAMMEEMLATGVAYRPEIPWVFSYNKRDLDNALPVAELAAMLNPEGRYPSVESVAPTGVGVFEGLKKLAMPVVATLRAELDGPTPTT